ncbi:MAG TPA: T9SS type A sorting domain-containing protein, partial [Flavobacteriales bacterium]|nr:T9SS type A sorting domain-containing protein [Flavobacteriales bacterium]
MDIDGEEEWNFSGRAVSISADGSTVAIGASDNDGNGTHAGHVRVYKFVSGNWIQQGADIDGEAAFDESGASVSLSDDGLTLAIGAIYNDGNGSGINTGQVRVYQWDGSAWTQLGADIDGEADDDSAGWSVSLSTDGLTLAIGAPGNSENGTYAGSVRVYEFVAGQWMQLGADIDGEAAGDVSGWSVSLSADGSTVAIGAPQNDGNGDDSGHVRVYEFMAGEWVQLGSDLDGEAVDDAFGGSISLSDDGVTLAIGARFNNGNGIRAGRVRVYEFLSGLWTPLGAAIDGEAAFDESGATVNLSANGLTLAIGAPNNDGYMFSAGHVRVYKFLSGGWIQHGADIDGEGESDHSGGSTSDISGCAIALSAGGSTVAIGAPFNGGNGNLSGHVRVYQDPNVVGIVENGFGPNLTVQPNPTTGHITISLDHYYNDLHVEVSDITGKQVATFNFGTAAQVTFELEGASGIYFLDITSAEGKSASVK